MFTQDFLIFNSASFKNSAPVNLGRLRLRLELARAVVELQKVVTAQKVLLVGQARA